LCYILISIVHRYLNHSCNVPSIEQFIIIYFHPISTSTSYFKNVGI